MLRPPVSRASTSSSPTINAWIAGARVGVDFRAAALDAQGGTSPAVTNKSDAYGPCPHSRLTLRISAIITRRRLRPTTSTIVLCGPNGAGKTNLIEAISLLAPGRGLRRATLEEVAFRKATALGPSPPNRGRAWARDTRHRDRTPHKTTKRLPNANAGSIASPSARRRHSPTISGWSGWCRRWIPCSSERLRSAGVSRPPGAGRRCPTCKPRQRTRTGAAVAQPAVGGAASRPALARRRRA